MNEWGWYWRWIRDFFAWTQGRQGIKKENTTTTSSLLLLSLSLSLSLSLILIARQPSKQARKGNTLKRETKIK